jgi:hypothetical protein
MRKHYLEDTYRTKKTRKTKSTLKLEVGKDTGTLGIKHW